MTASRFHLKKNVGNAVLYFSANIALVFVSYRLVIKQGGVGELGLWSTLMAWIYMIRLGDVGMASAISRFVSMRDLDDEAEKIRTYIDTGILFNMVLFFCLSIVGYFLMHSGMSGIVSEDALQKSLNVLPLMMLGFFLTNISGLMLGALQGLHWGFVSARLSTIGTFLQLIVVVFLVPRLGLLGLAWGVIAQHAVMVVAGWAFVRIRMATGPWLPVCWSREAHREMLGYSLKVQFVNLANGVFEPLSKILISRFGSLEMQGLYELAYKTVALPRNAVMSGAQATLPAMTGLLHSDPGAAKNLYNKVLKMVVRSTTGVLLLVVCVAPLISMLWMGDIKYSYWVFVACLAIGFVVNTAGAPAYNLGLAAGKIKNNLHSAILTLLSMIVFGIGLGYLFGVQGVGAAAGLALAAGGLYIKQRNEVDILNRACHG
ncbi:O-antigen/teichoic acid export membrane protein [Sphaerotilus hippei]|uniref:O-antigen/teichoic acid export membrane protein n=1 Tax=Sphaerotilus hippei TaxID=744406 RepID=A0A318GVJ7_9BURK|nr:oligosaccharide flippase family protein [Sphaerotilus hippei]PXW93247.1 O-antigen/teichoic acid export membrane protein [Sphaerotilus hippei]